MTDTNQGPCEALDVGSSIVEKQISQADNLKEETVVMPEQLESCVLSTENEVDKDKVKSEEVEEKVNQFHDNLDIKTNGHTNGSVIGIPDEESEPEIDGSDSEIDDKETGLNLPPHNETVSSNSPAPGSMITSNDKAETNTTADDTIDQNNETVDDGVPSIDLDKSVPELVTEYELLSQTSTKMYETVTQNSNTSQSSTFFSSSSSKPSKIPVTLDKKKSSIIRQNTYTIDSKKANDEILTTNELFVDKIDETEGKIKDSIFQRQNTYTIQKHTVHEARKISNEFKCISVSAKQIKEAKIEDYMEIRENITNSNCEEEFVFEDIIDKSEPHNLIETAEPLYKKPDDTLDPCNTVDSSNTNYKNSTVEVEDYFTNNENVTNQKHELDLALVQSLPDILPQVNKENSGLEGKPSVTESEFVIVRNDLGQNIVDNKLMDKDGPGIEDSDNQHVTKVEDQEEQRPIHNETCTGSYMAVQNPSNISTSVSLEYQNLAKEKCHLGNSIEKNFSQNDKIEESVVMSEQLENCIDRNNASSNPDELGKVQVKSANGDEILKTSRDNYDLETNGHTLSSLIGVTKDEISNETSKSYTKFDAKESELGFPEHIESVHDSSSTVITSIDKVETDQKSMMEDEKIGDKDKTDDDVVSTIDLDKSVSELVTEFELLSEDSALTSETDVMNSTKVDEINAANQSLSEVNQTIILYAEDKTHRSEVTESFQKDQDDNLNTLDDSNNKTKDATKQKHKLDLPLLQSVPNVNTDNQDFTGEIDTDEKNNCEDEISNKISKTNNELDAKESELAFPEHFESVHGSNSAAGAVITSSDKTETAPQITTEDEKIDHKDKADEDLVSNIDLHKSELVTEFELISEDSTLTSATDVSKSKKVDEITAANQSFNEVNQVMERLYAEEKTHTVEVTESLQKDQDDNHNICDTLDDSNNKTKDVTKQKHKLDLPLLQSVPNVNADNQDLTGEPNIQEIHTDDKHKCEDEVGTKMEENMGEHAIENNLLEEIYREPVTALHPEDIEDQHLDMDIPPKRVEDHYVTAEEVRTQKHKAVTKYETFIEEKSVPQNTSEKPPNVTSENQDLAREPEIIETPSFLSKHIPLVVPLLSIPVMGANINDDKADPDTESETIQRSESPSLLSKHIPLVVPILSIPVMGANINDEKADPDNESETIQRSEDVEQLIKDIRDPNLDCSLEDIEAMIDGKQLVAPNEDQKRVSPEFTSAATMIDRNLEKGFDPEDPAVKKIEDWECSNLNTSLESVERRSSKLKDVFKRRSRSEERKSLLSDISDNKNSEEEDEEDDKICCFNSWLLYIFIKIFD